MIAINSGQIAAMTAQLRAAVARVQAPQEASASAAAGATKTEKPDFAQALKSQLDQVNALQQSSDKLGQRFALGDDSVHLSDVMISSQKAGIALQATVQVRNKLVAAYHDIMNMQV